MPPKPIAIGVPEQGLPEKTYLPAFWRYALKYFAKTWIHRRV